MAKFKVIFDPALDRMLLQHTEFISRVSVPAAERFVVDFEAIICRLSENPYQFPSCDDPNLADIYRKAIFAIKRGGE